MAVKGLNSELGMGRLEKETRVTVSNLTLLSFSISLRT